MEEDKQQQNRSRQQGKQCQRKHRPYKQAYTAAAENKEMQQQHQQQQQQQEPQHNNQEYHPSSKITKRRIYLSKMMKMKKRRKTLNVFFNKHKHSFSTFATTLISTGSKIYGTSKRSLQKETTA